MADANADIIINVDTSIGIAEIKNLQRQIAELNAQLINSGAKQAKAAQNIQRNLINNINATGKFAANVKTISTTAESFTTSLEKNKLSMGEYFRFAGASTKTFGRLFTSEFNTIQKVAEERVKTLQTQYIKLGRDANGAMKAIAVRPLALDMENLATKTAIAAQKQQLLNQLLKQGSTNLLNFGKNTQWAGRQLMVGFTIPLAMMGTAAAKTFMQMEQQAIRFKRVYGDTFTATEDTDKMIKQVQDLASEFTKYGVAVEKTMEMAADAAAMGLMNADLLAQINQATRLSVLGGVEQEQALETTISLMNAFGTSANELTADINFLNAVENQTVTAIEDLTIAIPKAAPVIKQLGGDVKDLAFFLTAMKEGGINASEGANALKSGLASMINPTGKAVEFLEGFNINLKGIVEANKGDVKGTVVEFARALDTLDPLNRARAIEQLFGKFQFARLSTLFQNVIKEGTQADRVLGLAGQSTEELAILAERELKRVEDSPMFKFQKAVEDLKVSLVPLGEAFIKAITPVVEFAKGFLDRFNEMGDGAKNFAVIATTVVAGIGPILLMTFGLVANGVANLIKMFANIRAMMARAGTGSQDLAMSTDYLTQQQLEAAAVASSLDQAHSKLIQTFGVESAAVDKLAASYNRAANAQARALGIPGFGKNNRGTPPKKYNSGVVSVPGPKGAGDIVPAMLAPGEAVIPADMAQKHAPLISGMINDNLPGYRFGLNPFANMLGRSRVAVRMPKDVLAGMLGRDGNKARYQSAFETGTGADYISTVGLQNPAQARLRSEMEEKVFGLGPKTPASQRPTYGYARTSPMQALINKLFGFRGKQYNAVTAGKKIGDQGGSYYWTNPKTGKYEPNPNFRTDTLSRYGDVDLITKRRVGNRSQVAVSDALMDYQRSSGRTSLRPAPMRGATSAQTDSAFFDTRLNKPFGSYQSDPINSPQMYSSNPKAPYVETYTPGGFSLKEVSKIVAQDRTAARELQRLVDSTGLKIRVTPQNAPTVVKALANMFGTRFFAGTVSVPPVSYNIDAKDQLELGRIQSMVDTLIQSDPVKGRDIADSVFENFNDEKKLDSKKFRNLAVAMGEVLHKTSPTVLGQLLGETAEQQRDYRGASGAGVKTNIVDELEAAGKKDPSIKRDLDKFIRLNEEFYKAALEDPETEKEFNKYIKSVAGQEEAAKLKKSGLSDSEIKSSWLAKKAKAITNFDPANKKTYHGLARGHAGGLPAFIKRFASGWGPDFTSIDTRVMNGFISALTSNDGSKKTPLMLALEKANGISPVANSAALFERLASNASLSPAEIKMLGSLAKTAVDNDLIDSRSMRMVAKGLSKVDVSDMTDRTPKTAEKRNEIIKQVLKRPTLMLRGRKIPGFNKGVVSVPGPKGKGDVTPAMLTPGEAVIPAEMAKKYSPLIGAMISDAVPGYNGGLDGGFGGGDLPDWFTQKSGSKPSASPFDPPPSPVADPFSAGYNDSAYSGPQEKSPRRGAKGLVSSFANSMTSAVTSPKFKAGLKEGFLNAGEAMAKPFVTRLAKAGGNTLVDRKGNVVYDANTGTTYNKKGEAIAATSVGGGAAASGQNVDADGNPQNPKQLRKQRFAQGAQKAGMAGMGLGMVAGAATMLPGEAGQKAGEIAGPLMALSGLAMFIQGPLSLALVTIVAAFGAAAYGAYKVSEAYKKAEEEAIALRTALGGSTEAIRGLSEFAGRVTAGEIADRRRENKFRLIDVAGGKSTFGENFIKSEAGAALMENIKKQVAANAGDTNVARGLLGDQLKMGVVSGALSLDEASSIAAELGSQLGDASIGIKIRAEIQELIGPNGEDLTKDPVLVATRLADSSVSKIDNNKNTLAKSLESMPAGLQTQGQRNLATGGGVALAAGGGALAGAGIGAIVGSVVPVIGTAVGAAVGATIGAIAGGITGFVTITSGMEELSKKAGALSGAFIADATVALQQQTEIMDVLDSQYEQKLREAQAEGDITEYKRLQLEYDQKKNDIAAQSARISEAILASYDTADTATQEAMLTGIKAAADVKYKDDVNYAMYKPVIDTQLKTALDDKQITGAQELILRQQMLTGDLDPAAMSQLLTTATTTGQMSAIMTIVTKFGGDTASEMNSVLNMIKGDDPAANTARVNLITSVSKAEGEAEAMDLIDFALDVQALGGVLENSVNTFLNYYEGDTKAKAALQSIIDDLAAKKVTTVDLAYEVNPVLKETGKLGDAFNEEYFNKLKSEEQKETYIQTISTILNVPAPQVVMSDDFKNWLADEGAKYGAYPGGHSVQWWARTYAESMGQKVTETGVVLGNQGSTTPEPEKPKNTGGAKEDPYEDVLRRLKEIRNASINAKGGLKELNRILGGKKDLKLFQGIEQQLISKGGSRGFIDWVMGQDDAIQKKFITIKNGIVSLTAKGREMSKAFNEIAMGDFQAQQKQTSRDLTNQNIALRKIVGLNVSYAVGYEIVADAATATAIAQAKDKNEIKQIVAATQERIRLQKKFNDLEAARGVLQETAERNANEKAIKGSKKFSFIEQEAILSDDALMTFFENKNWTGFNQRMAQLLIDPEFMAKMFENGLNMAMDQFAAKEEKLRIDAELLLEDFTIPGMVADKIGKGARGIISQAQNDIANLNYDIDDWEASLKGIEEQEEKINKKYDDKFEALDRIQRANESISAQQRGQLSIADALSKGDIVAAARAEQELREQQAAEALERQRQSLERSRDAELKNLTTTVNGQKYTRLQIEEKIKGLQKEIFEIEEKRLEPAQEAVRESQFKLEKDTAALEVAGNTKLEWEQIANNVETAKTNSADYDAAIQAALGTVTAITSYWDDLDERTVTTYQNVVTKYSSVGTPPVITGDTETTIKPKVETKDTGNGGRDTGSGNGGNGGNRDTDPPKQDPPSGTSGGQSKDAPPPYSPGPGKKWQWNESKKSWDIVNIPAAPTPGSSKDMPISAPSLKADSSESSPQTFTVTRGRWFKMPVGSNIYSTKLNGNSWTIKYGKKPGTYTTSQGKTASWWSTEYGKGAKGNSVLANDVLGFTETPRDSHKQYPKSFPTDAIGFNSGGIVAARFANMGADVVPAMLTPGEFVLSKYAVDSFGTDNLKAINNGTYKGDSVYNYEVNVSVQTDANADQIASAVLARIKQIDSQKLRGNRF